jgi:hypothetical protein
MKRNTINKIATVIGWTPAIAGFLSGANAMCMAYKNGQLGSLGYTTAMATNMTGTILGGVMLTSAVNTVLEKLETEE